MSNQIVFKGLHLPPAVFLSEDIVSILGILSEIILKFFQDGREFLGNLITGVVKGGVMKVTVKDQGFFQGNFGENQLGKISRGMVIIDHRGGPPIGE